MGKLDMYTQQILTVMQPAILTSPYRAIYRLHPGYPAVFIFHRTIKNDESKVILGDFKDWVRRYAGGVDDLELALLDRTIIPTGRFISTPPAPIFSFN